MPPVAPLPELEVAAQLQRHEVRLAELDRRIGRLELDQPLQRGVPTFRPKDLPALKPKPTVIPEERKTPKAIPLREIPKPIVPKPVAPKVVHPPAAPKPKPVPAFLGEDDFFEKLKRSEPAKPSEPKESWEVRLATVWLPRVAGVLILVGAAIGATLLPEQLGKPVRVLLGYALMGGLVAGGWFVQRRHERLGRLTMAIGLAVGYFVSFAAHYIPPMHVFPVIPSIALMLAFVGTLAVLAERWKSQSIAIAGLSLGVIAALVSAQTSQSFCLVALGILALGAGVLLVRNEWKALTAVALSGTYLATFILWVLFPLGDAKGEVIAHLGALACYHAIFTAAFWRWGRVWVARERAFDEAATHDAAPVMQPGLLPYSTSFAIVNSLGLAGLSLFLVWQTKVFWPQVEYLLFALTAVEVIRLVAPALRRGTLLTFHILSAAALLSAGLVAATSGLTEASVLAAEALILSIAASRARVLRLLRPLTAVCAGLAVTSITGFGATTTFPQLVAQMIPGLLLLASTLRWEAVWVTGPHPFASGLIAWLEAASGQFRSITATALLIAAIHSFPSATPDIVELAIYCSVGMALLLGITVLRATSWTIAAACLSMLSCAFFIDEQGPALLFITWAVLSILLWNQARRTIRHSIGRVLIDLMLVPAVFLAAAASVQVCSSIAEDFQGVLIAIVGLAAIGLELLAQRIPVLPKLIPGFVEDEAERGERTTRWESYEAHPAGRAFRFGTLFGLLALLIGTLLTSVSDAYEGLLSPILLGAIFAGLWFAGQLRPHALRILRYAIPIAFLFVALFAPFTYWNSREPALFISTAIAIGVFALGSSRRCPWTTTPALLMLALMPALGIGAYTAGRFEIGGLALFGLLSALEIVAASRVIVWSQGRWQLGETDTRISGGIALAMRIWLPVGAAIVALSALSTGQFLPAQMITVAWAAVGVAFLVAGFIFIDRPMRHTALAVLGVSVARIFLRDLVEADTLTKSIAFLGVGVLAICASIAYGILRKRLAPPPK
ncbi:DUF2339 domain-containing protein [bacterium]|nr:DUF2339 domain-containing protein [bacterium]